MDFVVNFVSFNLRNQLSKLDIERLLIIAKCVIPCMNGGKCKGDNKCRCPYGLGGDHCEIGRRQRSTCKKPCKNGKCLENHTCSCDKGYFGKFCNRKREHHKKQNTLTRR